jgi:hypothetical protein
MAFEMISVGWMTDVLKTILFALIMLSPVLLQAILGLKALKGKITWKFWVVCVVSLMGQIAVTSGYLMAMASVMRQHGIRDGLGFVTVAILGAFFALLIVLIAVFQWLFYTYWVKR